MERSTYLVCAVVLLIIFSSNYCLCDDQSNNQESNLHKKNTTSRYCGNSLVRAMRLICDGNYAEPNLKRSLDEPIKLRRNRRYKIWKQKFNVKDSDLLTLIELDDQYQLLFGSEIHQNNHLPNYIVSHSLNSQLNDASNNLEMNKNRRKSLLNQSKETNKKKPDGLVRNKRGIYEQCCQKPCTVKYMKSYCQNSSLL